MIIAHGLLFNSQHLPLPTHTLATLFHGDVLFGLPPLAPLASPSRSQPS